MKISFCFFMLFVSSFVWASIKQGIEKSFYPDGKRAFERSYKDGKKVGEHYTWYPNGQMRSLSRFEKPDAMGLYKEWHDNGVLATQIKFENGYEVDTKIYRRTGQIYLNRVVRNGRVYGLPGGRACLQVQGATNVK